MRQNSEQRIWNPVCTNARHQRCCSILLALIGVFLSAEGALAQPDTLWTRRYDSGYNDYASAMAIDREGNIVVTGDSKNGLNYDYLTIKYSSSGNFIWARHYDGGHEDGAYDIAVDDSGNIIVTGYSNNGSNSDWLTIKYGPSGDILWTQRYDGGKYDSPDGVVVDDSGNIIVTGDSDSAKIFGYFTIKYSSSGDTIWTRRYDGGFPIDVTVDDSGNIIVIGTFWNAAPFASDYYMIKYSLSGDIVWTGSYLSEGNDLPRAGALDDSGNVVMVGWMDYTCGGPYDYWVMKYNPSLEDTLWLRCYEEGHTPYGVAIDNSQNIIVTGWPYTIKYTTSGEVVWVTDIDSSFCARGIAIDDSGNIVVTGRYDTGSNHDYLTIKYGNDIGIEEESTNCRMQLAGLEIYPNPSLRMTTIRYSVPRKARVSLKVFDVSGRCVKTLVNGEKNLGCHETELGTKNLAPGVYFARLQAGDHKEVQKLILVQ